MKSHKFSTIKNAVASLPWKKTLAKLQASKDSNVGIIDCEDATNRLNRQVPSKCRTYAPVCIFCQKENKYRKGQRTDSLLYNVGNSELMKNIREAATRKLDSRILAILSRGIVAAEGHYHRLCYRDYTRKENINDSCDKIKTNNDAQYEDVVNQSNGELFFFIKNDLFTNPHVKAMAELSHKLFQSMNLYGVNHVKYSTKKYIPWKLESEFGKSQHIFPDAKGKLLLCPDILTVCELAKENQSLKTDRHDLNIRTEDPVDKAALQVRTDIKKCK